MGITRQMLLKIKEEINNDPQGLGYAGKTDAEMLDILNNAVRIQRVVEDVLPAPINRILSGIAEGPNAIDLTELTQAKVVT